MLKFEVGTRVIGLGFGMGGSEGAVYMAYPAASGLHRHQAPVAASLPHLEILLTSLSRIFLRSVFLILP